MTHPTTSRTREAGRTRRRPQYHEVPFVDLPMTEDLLLLAIVEAATMFRWRVHHDRRSDLARQQGHAGFPDVVAIRGGRVKVFELKSERGQLSTEQFGWQLEMPQNSHAFEYRVVRPADLDDVIESLR